MEYLETIMRYASSAGKSLTKHNVEKIITQIEMNYPERSKVTMTMAERDASFSEEMNNAREKELIRYLKQDMEK